MNIIFYVLIASGIIFFTVVIYHELVAKFLETHPRGQFIAKLTRHPLIVAYLGIVIGGFGLNFVQTNQSKQEAILARRLQTIDDVSKYISQCARVLRSIENQITSKNANVVDSLSNPGENALPVVYDQTREFESLLRTHVWLYFPTHTTHMKFQQLTDKFDEAVNSGFKVLNDKRNINWTVCANYVHAIDDLGKQTIILLGKEVGRESGDGEEVLRSGSTDDTFK